MKRGKRRIGKILTMLLICTVCMQFTVSIGSMAVYADNGQAAAAPIGSWALINLICTVVAVAGAVQAMIRSKEENEYMDDEQQKEFESDLRKSRIAKGAGIAAAAAAIMAFILTEDMRLPMVLIDQWTMLMAILFAAQALTAVINRKYTET